MWQHDVIDITGAAYVRALDGVWDGWQPALRRAERLLRGTAWRDTLEREDVVAELAHAQYRAHVTAELVAGLDAPPQAAASNARLAAALAACRDTLGVLGVRAELDDLDPDESSIGLGALTLTRHAYERASAPPPLSPMTAPPAIDDAAATHDAARRRSLMTRAALWAMVATSFGLLAILLVSELLRSTPT